MRRFFKSMAFRIFAVVLAALLCGTALAAVSRSSVSPVTAAVSVVFTPAHRIASAVARTFSSLPFTFRSSSALLKENKALQKQIDSLMDQMVDYEQIKKKNELYKEFLQVKEEHEDYTFVPACIIGRNASDRVGTVTLNAGSSEGVEVNDPVIYGNYVVGVVTSVAPLQCTVSTLLNPSVNVSAYEVRTRDLGYVTTTTELAQQGLCIMPGLSNTTAVTAGGMVCTSGVGGIYPRDLIIGTVTDVIDGTVDISASAVIKPGADLEEVTDVFIITYFRGKAGAGD